MYSARTPTDGSSVPFTPSDAATPSPSPPHQGYRQTSRSILESVQQSIPASEPSPTLVYGSWASLPLPLPSQPPQQSVQPSPTGNVRPDPSDAAEPTDLAAASSSAGLSPPTVAAVVISVVAAAAAAFAAFALRRRSRNLKDAPGAPAAASNVASSTDAPPPPSSLLETTDQREQRQQLDQRDRISKITDDNELAMLSRSSSAQTFHDADGPEIDAPIVAAPLIVKPLAHPPETSLNVRPSPIPPEESSDLAYSASTPKPAAATVISVAPSPAAATDALPYLGINSNTPAFNVAPFPVATVAPALPPPHPSNLDPDSDDQKSIVSLNSILINDSNARIISHVSDIDAAMQSDTINPDRTRESSAMSTSTVVAASIAGPITHTSSVNTLETSSGLSPESDHIPLQNLSGANLPPQSVHITNATKPIAGMNMVSNLTVALADGSITTVVGSINVNKIAAGSGGVTDPKDVAAKLHDHHDGQQQSQQCTPARELETNDSSDNHTLRELAAATRQPAVFAAAIRTNDMQRPLTFTNEDISFGEDDYGFSPQPDGASKRVSGPELVLRATDSASMRSETALSSGSINNSNASLVMMLQGISVPGPASVSTSSPYATAGSQGLDSRYFTAPDALTNADQSRDMFFTPAGSYVTQDEWSITSQSSRQTFFTAVEGSIIGSSRARSVESNAAADAMSMGQGSVTSHDGGSVASLPSQYMSVHSFGSATASESASLVLTSPSGNPASVPTLPSDRDAPATSSTGATDTADEDVSQKSTTTVTRPT